MAVQVHWDDDERTIIRLEYLGNWQWAEHNVALTEARIKMQTQRHPVDLIFDNRSGAPAPVPQSFPLIQLLTGMPATWSRRLVLVGAKHPLIRWVVHHIVGNFGRTCGLGNFAVVKTLPEARAMLQNWRSERHESNLPLTSATPLPEPHHGDR